MHNAIFKSVFGEMWDALPHVMHQHYANRPYTSDRVTVRGIMTVELSRVARCLTPLMRLSKALAPYAAEHVPVTVHFDSDVASDAFCFNRIFHYPNTPPYHFRSRMMPAGGNRVIEYMANGIGWHAAYGYDGKKVTMTHQGYKMKLWGKTISLPLEWLFGRGYAEEIALTDDTFKMMMEIRHALFGRVYAYSGTFTITEVQYDE